MKINERAQRRKWHLYAETEELTIICRFVVEEGMERIAPAKLYMGRRSKAVVQRVRGCLGVVEEQMQARFDALAAEIRTEAK